MKEYLPSKKFVISIGILVAILAIMTSVYYLYAFIKGKYFRNTGTLTIGKGGNIQKDTNSNGIADWEESLWGFDPTKDGEKNKQAIQAKKDALRQSSTYTSNASNQNLSEDETAAREFFAAIMSLQQSGNLNDASVQSIAEAMGEKIVAVPLENKYKTGDIKTVAATDKNTSAYYISYLNLLAKYKDKGMGNEVNLIAQGIQNNDPQAIKVAVGISNAYRSFNVDMLKIVAPSTLAQAHLNMINNYEKIAESIEGMARVLDEPLTGMRAFINYKKSYDALLEEINKISTI
jgi:hypothetical protein